VIATIISMRCKGMTLARMPLFVWLMLVVSAMVVVALLPLTAAQIMLLLDRYLGAHFFDTPAGGSARASPLLDAAIHSALEFNHSDSVRLRAREVASCLTRCLVRAISNHRNAFQR
jgi:hypothetical protein